MTPPPPSSSMMPPTRLIDLAALDAFDLLDEYEAEIYTRSFHHAPASVQEEIRRIQAELVTDAALLCTDEPPADLRRRVLKHVNSAIEKDGSRYAPLATIGAGGRDDRNGRSSRLPVMPTLYVWRAATFVLAGVAVLLLLMMTLTQQHANQVTQWALNNLTSDQLQRYIGPDFRTFFFNHGTRHHVFLNPDDPNDTAQAVLLINEQNGQAFLIVDHMPNFSNGAEYTVSVVLGDDGDHRINLHRFEFQGNLVSLQLDVSHVPDIAAARWEITGPDGYVLVA